MFLQREATRGEEMKLENVQIETKNKEHYEVVEGQMEAKYQLRYMTGLLFLILAILETNKILVILYSFLAIVEILASHWYSFKSKQKREQMEKILIQTLTMIACGMSYALTILTTTALIKLLTEGLK